MSEEVTSVTKEVESLELNNTNAAEAAVESNDVEKKKKKNKKKKKKSGNFPNAISKEFESGRYPEGQWIDYAGEDGIKRTTDEEKRYLDNQQFQNWNEYRKGAEIHRRVRKHAQEVFKPGMKMIEVAETIENLVREYSGTNDSKLGGMGFPCGVSLNHCAAHYTPNAGDKTVLSYDDVMKVDFGVHVNGHIVDCAWTHTFNEKYDPLLAAVKESTDAGINAAGIDVRVTDIGEAVEEVMQSHEIELNGKVYPIKCIRNLNGHTILKYKIHGGKSIPIVKNGDTTKLEEGETIAIETFGSTGTGYVISSGECSHYMRTDTPAGTPRLEKARELLNTIDTHFGTLPFCRRYIDRIVDDDKYLFALNSLVKDDILSEHPPLVDAPGCYTAQFEHTILLHPTRKEVVSRGDDY